jgi:hypothetical protein
MIAFVVLVFMEVQDVSTPLAEALVRAAETALGPQVTLSVRPIERDAPDESAAAIGRREGAHAVARVSWTGLERNAAHVGVIVVADGRAKAEALTFEGTDPLAERGRALGLVLASLLRPEVPEPAVAPAAASPPPEAAAVRAPPAPLPRARWALDAAAEGGLALGGTGSGAGGLVGLRWLAFRRVGFRAGGRARFGEVGAAQAALTTFSVAAGAIVSLREPSDGGRLGLDVRADALLLYESLSHLSSDDSQAVRQGRLLPGASLMAELRWSLSPVVSLLLSTGPEAAFGTTRVFVHQTEVTRLAPLRLVVQGGLIAAF